MSPPLVARAELMSMDTSASVWSMTMAPPEGRCDFALEGGFDLAFDLEAVEQRHGVLVELELAQVVRHHLLHEFAGRLEDFLAVDQDFADIVAQVVAQGADDDVAFLVDQERRRALLGGALDDAPQLQQVVEVPLQFFAAAADAGGAHDQAHALGDVQGGHGITHQVAIFAFDAPRDAAGARVVGHQHQVATGQADEGGQRGALVAALFLFDLDDDFLAFVQGILDIEAAAGLACGFTEVAAGDFLERQEAVAFAAVVDKGGLETGLDAGDFTFVDVGLFLLAGGDFDIQVVEFLAIDQGDTQLFGLRGVDQHSFHVFCLSCARPGHAATLPAAGRYRDTQPTGTGYRHTRQRNRLYDGQ